MDHLAPLPRDSFMRVANRAEGERLRKEKEEKRKKKQRKLQALEWGRTPIAMTMMMMAMTLR